MLPDNLDMQLDVARNANDFSGLDKLRTAARQDEKGALKEVAKHFEAIFVRMMLKSMRDSADVLADEDSPFNSQQVKFYRDMHDQQLATELSNTGGLGLADLIVRQLGGDPNYTPASLVSPDRVYVVPAATSNENQSTDKPARVDMGTRQAAFADKQQFVEALLPLAEQATQNSPVDGLSMIAQAAVETGWGQQMIHSLGGQNSHNLFGIKASKNWQGDRTLIDSVEYKDGSASKVRSAFKAYPGFSDAMQDYVRTLENSPRYSEALKAADNPQTFFSELQQAGYATDPQYANKIMSVLDFVRSVAANAASSR